MKDKTPTKQKTELGLSSRCLSLKNISENMQKELISIMYVFNINSFTEGINKIIWLNSCFSYLSLVITPNKFRQLSIFEKNKLEKNKQRSKEKKNSLSKPRTFLTELWCSFDSYSEIFDVSVWEAMFQSSRFIEVKMTTYSCGDEDGHKIRLHTFHICRCFY